MQRITVPSLALLLTVTTGALSAAAPSAEPQQGPSAKHSRRSSNHWAFQPIQRPALPTVKHTEWVQTPPDAFILARLEQEGLEPSPAADRETLIRRLSLDLRGLLPSLDEVDAFLNDKRPGAYERLVDRMLASPHYGERWGRHWLDVARYADSNGYTIDGPRSIWKYRDWVIDAFNRDMPFDRFTIEQLAGDLLPDADTPQLIATGFHRNTLINQEGGTDDEQFRVEAVVDRVETTGAAWLGLTIGCARCHDHKFDPISQREFYGLFAILNNCDEPEIRVPSPEQTERMNTLRAEIADVEQRLSQNDAELLKGLPEWEQRIAGQAGVGSAGGDVWTPLDPLTLGSEKGSVLAKQDDKSIYVDFSIPANDTFIVTADAPLKRITGIRLEALTHPSLPKGGPGRASNGNFVLSEFEVLAAPRNAHRNNVVRSLRERKVNSRSESTTLDAAPGPQPVRLAKAVADHSQEGWPVMQSIDGKSDTGWAINVKQGSLNVDREAIYLPAEPIESEHGSRLTIKLHHDHSEAGYLLGRFRLSVSSAPQDVLQVPASIRKIVAVPADKRSKEQQQQLETAFKHTDDTRNPLAAKLDRLTKQEQRLGKAIPTTMILRERTKDRRETHVHIRGNFLNKGELVQPDVPQVLPPFPEDVGNPTRLDFARWLVAPENPLTARVTVNRYWQRFFGVGLVRTENDFGTQGEKPSHPELLDWLATEFMRRNWSVKSLHRLIVTSAVYRQSSAMRPELLKRDPDNRLLARQSRVRLPAEIVRDVSLTASGLLTKTIGGPSVYPPQPEGIYALTQIKKAWPVDKGPDRYRRGMYTYFWRSSPYPFLVTFDAPAATTTCTRRVRSNTPLQALTLANDSAFFEMARALAGRLLRDGPPDDAGRIRLAFRLCLSRSPDERELARLTEFLEAQRRMFADEKQQAQAARPMNVPQDVSAAEGAAWTALARVLLNLDEFITRE